MHAFASPRLRSFLVSMLLGAFVFGSVITISFLLSPSTAYGQDGEGEGEKPPVVEKEKKKGNPLVRGFRWILSGVKDIIETAVILFIIAISFGMVALLIVLLFDIRMGEAAPPALVDEFMELINKHRPKEAYELVKNDSSLLGRALTAGMERLKYGIEDAREAMFAAGEAVKAGKDSWISYLAVVGTLGPLLGLVGTVTGMIGAFSELGGSDKAPDAAVLANEISTALVLTFLGIFIAVPAVFLYSFFKNRLINISVNTMNLADDLLTQTYHSTKKATASGTTSTDRGTSASVQAK